ncbi:hypothetical protein [Microvirga alba]|uniref:Uncharacterized protein n=1 Tax=Microvirga alba TaxID=2791025 RepID=A0A931FP98_9HYPH|nr:hypothetical protein [Microvirga alba]MBF9234784.1 hypothetical protein [Microvirga alba]
MSETDPEFLALKEHAARFYALIGYCVTHYQSLEDTLPDLFAVALGAEQKKALAVFSAVRGLEDKFAIISAALLDATKEQKHEWASLRVRIKLASDARNQIAHANPVQIPVIKITRRNEVPSPVGIIGTGGPGRMELRKQTRNGERIWTLDLLREERARIVELSNQLCAFVVRLKKEKASTSYRGS